MAEFLMQLEQAAGVAEQLGAVVDRPVYAQSITTVDGALLFMCGRDGIHHLGLLTERADARGFDLELRPVDWQGRALWLGVGETNHANASRLRQVLPHMAPVRVGRNKAAGLGDRLGIATPGHIRAMRHVRGIIPVLAQQSIREMERTNRTPSAVLDDATWGAFQEGWHERYGADADHLKTVEDIDLCVDAGFVMYTFDPRDQVDNDAETDSLEVLREKYARLPWERLETTPELVFRTYAGQSWYLDATHRLAMSETGLLRAACKYSLALAHIRDLYRHLVERIGSRPWEVEVSVDETDTPTRPAEHYFVARELARLGVEWVSLAPRYEGRFEKGVDYIGDLDAFERDWQWHAAIARAVGPYKLSLHSGSDKFSIYPIAARYAGDLIHLKTAGTSYLEALRAVAHINPELFREILAFAVGQYEKERRSYHVSAELNRVPAPESLSDEELEILLDDFNARQVLHVTFGVVLSATDEQGNPLFRQALYDLLAQHEQVHYDMLEKHLARHVLPFSD